MSQHLWFTKDHGIEATGDAQHVFDRVGVGMRVQVGLYLVMTDTVKTRQPLYRPGAGMIIDTAVDLGAVAGGENGRFLDFTHARQILEGIGHDFAGKTQLFTQFQWRGGMVQAVCQNTHKNSLPVFF